MFSIGDIVYTKIVDGPNYFHLFAVVEQIIDDKILAKHLGKKYGNSNKHKKDLFGTWTATIPCIEKKISKQFILPSNMKYKVYNNNVTLYDYKDEIQ